MGLYIVAFALLISGCGQVYNKVASTQVPTVNQSMPTMPDDRDVKFVTGQFYADAQSLGKKVATNIKSISFVDSFDDEESDSTIGRCTLYIALSGDVAYGEIELLKPNWTAGSDQFKKTLLYHELGHCSLQLAHVEQNSGAIMEPIVLSDKFAQDNWFDLVVDEFNSSTLGLTLLQPGQDGDGCVEMVTLTK